MADKALARACCDASGCYKEACDLVGRALCRTAAAPGEGLGDMKPHRSCLEKEQATWQRHVGSYPLSGISAKHEWSLPVTPVNNKMVLEFVGR